MRLVLVSCSVCVVWVCVVLCSVGLFRLVSVVSDLCRWMVIFSMLVLLCVSGV